MPLPRWTREQQDASGRHGSRVCGPCQWGRTEPPIKRRMEVKPIDQNEIEAIRALLSSKPGRSDGRSDASVSMRSVRSGLWPTTSRLSRWTCRCARRVVDRSGERRLTRSDVLPWRRLLLGIDPQPSALGDRGRPGGRGPHARRSVSSRAGAPISRSAGGCPDGLALSATAGHCSKAHRGWRRQRRRRVRHRQVNPGVTGSWHT